MATLATTADKKAPVSPEEKPERKLKLKLHGVAPTDVDVGDFLARLTAKPLFSQVELAYSQERVENAHVMRDFAITFAMDLTGLSTTPASPPSTVATVSPAEGGH